MAHSSFFPQFLKKIVRKSDGTELPLKVKEVKGGRNTDGVIFSHGFYWERMKNIAFNFYLLLSGSFSLEKKEAKIRKKSIVNVEMKLFF